MANELPPLQSDDPLGRGIFSGGQAKNARKGKIPHHVFLEKIGASGLSVDRLGHAPDREMTQIADAVALGRGRRFYGWAVVTVADASRDGRTVEPAPLLGNRYHAEIYLNRKPGEELRDRQKQHALTLSAASHWRSRA